MGQKNFRLAVVLVAGLGVSVGWSDAQTAITAPHQKIVSNPMQIAIEKEVQGAQGATPNSPNPAQINHNTATVPNITPNVDPRAQTSGAAVSADFSAGIASLLSAKSALANSGNRWGGHKQTAVRMIDRAIAACGQNQIASPPERQSPPANEQSAMQDGITQLNSAKSVFEQTANGGSACSTTAIPLINQALQELQAGVDFAKSHNNY